MAAKKFIKYSPNATGIQFQAHCQRYFGMIGQKAFEADPQMFSESVMLLVAFQFGHEHTETPPELN